MYGQSAQPDEPATTGDAQAYSQALDAGKRAESVKDYGLAEKEYLRALTFAQKLQASEGSEAAGTVLRKLGNLYGLQQRYKDAESAYRQLFGIFSARPQTDASDMAWVLVEVGLLANLTGRYDEGEQTLNEAMQHYRSCLQRFGPAAVECLKGLANAETIQGSYFVLRGKLEMAGPLIEHVMGLPDNMVEPSSRYASMQAYAVILESRGKLDEALKIRERAASYRKASPEQQAPQK